MPFKISNNSYTEYFEQKKQITPLFYRAVLKFLKAHPREHNCRELYEHMEMGGKLALFRCRADYYSKMEKKLECYNIAFLKTIARDGRTGFVIADKDIEKTKDQIEAVLKDASQHTNLVLIDEIGGKKSIKKGHSEQIVIFSNLSKEKALRFKREIIEKMKLQEIGFEEMKDGTFRIGIYDEDMSVKTDTGFTIRKLMLMTNFLFASSFRDAARKREEKTYEFKKQMLWGREHKEELRQHPLYIIGKFGEFLQMDGQSLSVGRIYVEEDGNVKIINESKIYENDHNYEELKAEYIASLVEPQATFTPSEAVHMARENAAAIRLPMQDEQAMESIEKVVDKIDFMITERMAYDRDLSQIEDPGLDMAAYKNQVTDVVEAITMNRELDGYALSDLTKVGKELETIGFSEKENKKLIHDLNNVSVRGNFIDSTARVNIKEVTKNIEKSRSAPQKNKGLTRNDISLRQLKEEVQRQ